MISTCCLGAHALLWCVKVVRCLIIGTICEFVSLTPRNTSKAPTTSTTSECEKHVVLPIAPLPLRPGTPNLPRPTSGRARGLRPCRRWVEMWFWSAPGPFRYNLDFTPIHRGNKKVPACVRCWNILGKGGNSSNAPIVCLTCGKGLCRRHWMEFPPHKAYYEANGIKWEDVGDA